MKKQYYLILLFLFFSLLSLSAQDTPHKLWNTVNNIGKEELTADERNVVKNIDADYFKISETNISTLLKNVADKYSDRISLQLPLGGAKPVTVQLNHYNTMHPDLAKRYPHIRTYRGNKNGKNIYLTVSPLGIHAYITSGNSLTFIEPLSNNTTTMYHRYSIEDYNNYENIVNCGVTDEMMESAIQEGIKAQKRSDDEHVLRKYRIAILATEAFSAEFGHDFDRTLAEVTDLVNGLNAIFVKEVGIQFEMIPESDELIFTDIDNDPFGDRNQEGNFLLNTSTREFYEIIGKDAFDVGHVLSAFCSGGFAGVSKFEIVCNDTKKGAGVTCYGLSSNFLLTNAHEFGHHFGASHTWDNCPPSLQQRTSSTAVEPGSGSTIMSYAGLCGDQNLDVPRGTYFHNVSIEQMILYSRTNLGSTCAEVIEVDNMTPTVELLDESGVYIPISTFFELKGAGTDPDGDNLQFNWEQVNTGPISQLGMPMGSAPSFISQPPQSEPFRMFPKRTNALAHVSEVTEVLPTYERDLNFTLTARDNDEVSGAVAWKEIELHVTENAGPFRITKPNGNTSVTAGQKVLVEWDVANTDKEPVNCERVNILYSSSGGYTFNKIISKNTLNDGREEVLLPGEYTDLARIKIKAVDNVFFDFNPASFDVVEPDSATYALTYGPRFQSVCTPTTHTININTESLLDYEGDITFSILDTLPEDVIATFGADVISAGETTTLDFNLDDFDEIGSYEFDIQAASASDTTVFTVGFETVANFYSNFKLVSPLNSAENVDQATYFDWVGDDDAEGYQLQVSKVADFSTTALDRRISGTEFQLVNLLDKSSAYFWRVRPYNACGDAEWSEIRLFKTIQQTCKTISTGADDRFITAQGKPLVKSPLEVDFSGPVEDVNVKSIIGSHSFIGDLSVRLKSPAGTEVSLWERECSNGSDFNLGFDDETSQGITCPINRGRTYKPLDSLATYNGEDVNGEWTLIIKDHMSGGGGQLDEWNLELCFQSQVEAPTYFKNDTLRVQYDKDRSLLTAISLGNPDFSPEEIQIIPYKFPEHAILLKKDDNGNETMITAGDSINMEEVYSGEIYARYTGGGSDVYDSLKYFAITPDGGWTGNKKLPIKYQTMVSVEQPDGLNNHAIELWPSPVESTLNFTLKGNSINGEWSLYTLYGKKVDFLSVQSSSITSRMNISKYPAGVYFLRWESDKGVLSRKFIIQ